MLEQACRLLQSYDLRVTPQRRAILEILAGSRGEHPDSDEIYRRLAAKKTGRKIGRATVYRTLELFERLGIVQRLALEHPPARYELILPDRFIHHHLICLKCGKLLELDDLAAREFKNTVLDKKGFAVADKAMKIYGYCRNCRKTSLPEECALV
ncbi:MAG TPA: transcriptional repressor [Firmicutes bacterium]|jgi:Fur family ferric uptake transcriptional regulator|nr:transcriptional repressor [Bacillota bacterium]